MSPQRSEMPDIDMDFDDEERRLELLSTSVRFMDLSVFLMLLHCSTIKAKQAINDACRVYPVYMGQRLSKMIPRV